MGYQNDYCSRLHSQPADGDLSLLDSILWPLFHYHPGEITFDESAWEAYKEANRQFAKAVAREIQDGDLVWVCRDRD